jgi:hypothetical protein
MDTDDKNAPNDCKRQQLTLAVFVALRGRAGGLTPDDAVDVVLNLRSATSPGPHRSGPERHK